MLIFSVNAGCLPFKKPTDGRVFPDQETYNIGDSVTVYCRNGFDLIGDETLGCLSTGLWLGEIPTCKPTENCKYGLYQGWAIYGPRAACGPRAILVRPARPSEEKIIWITIICVCLLELWIRPATKITTLFWPAVVKKLPTTNIVG